jgi:outer membrane protein insertion porin family
VLQIDEGPVERIWSVQFEGNDPSLATDARLKTLIKSKPGVLKYLFRGRLDHSVIEQDLDRLTVYYRDLGYFRAQVSRELRYDESGQWVSLIFVIDEGPRYKIRNLEVIGNEKFAAQQLKQQLTLKPGDYFNMPKMRRDENMLRELYGSQGHIFADIQAVPRFMEQPGELDLVFNIKEGELFRVGEIKIHVAGEHPHTRKSVILNRLSLRPGDIIDIRKVRASERRLKASQLFVTNPSEGQPPRIVIRPPDIEEAAEIARKRKTTYYRGQSPEATAPLRRSRDMVLDVFAQPVPDRPQPTR